MGYTHYWTPTPDVAAENWTAFVALSRRVVSLASARGITVIGPSGEDGEPEFTDAEVAFNGSGDLAHESFTVTRGGAWEFCKTACKPYDIAAVACLVIGEALGILRATSDGDETDWRDGLDLAREVMPGAPMPTLER